MTYRPLWSSVAKPLRNSISVANLRVDIKFHTFRLEISLRLISIDLDLLRVIVLKHWWTLFLLIQVWDWTVSLIHIKVLICNYLSHFLRVLLSLRIIVITYWAICDNGVFKKLTKRWVFAECSLLSRTPANVTYLYTLNGLAVIVAMFVVLHLFKYFD